MTAKNPALFRILDANLDRAREGLRVIEEWCRFGLDRSDLASQCKDLRQQLAQWHRSDYHQARDTPNDVGTALNHPNESKRDNIPSLLAANFNRVQEALRVLEEYGKIETPDLASSCKQMRYQVYSLESLLESRPLYQKLLKTKLYLVTSPHENLLGVVEAALKGGLKLVQYREKDLPDCDRLPQAIALRQLCHQYDALFIVNDRADLAYAADADGVHLGQQDVPMEVARAILGPQKIVGLSTTNPSEMERAIREKADYIGVGPIFETPTKVGKSAVGLDYIRYAIDHAPMPWFTIGGIDANNLADIVGAGATRAALVRAIMKADNPTQSTQTLKRILQEP
jgi:thiamine-phosphate pyrophosphorylase